MVVPWAAALRILGPGSRVISLGHGGSAEAQRCQLSSSVLIGHSGLDSGFTLCLLARVLISRVSVSEQMVPVHSIAQTRWYNVMSLVPVGFRISRLERLNAFVGMWAPKI